MNRRVRCSEAPDGVALTSATDDMSERQKKIDFRFSINILIKKRKFRAMATVLFDTPAAAYSRVQEIGVSMEALQRAIASGHAGRIGSTDNDPPFIPGTMAWSFTVRALRDELVPHGWRKSDPGNYSLVINDKRKINIVVASGDAMVRTRSTPRTKSIKGLYTEAATVRNRIESDLFPDTLSDELRRVASILEYPTYILLIFITDEEYRAELSLPDEMEDGQVVSWKERIFIPDSDSDFSGKTIELLPADFGETVDVPVRRKG
jgi:hypothetical protein